MLAKVSLQKDWGSFKLNHRQSGARLRHGGLQHRGFDTSRKLLIPLPDHKVLSGQQRSAAAWDVPPGRLPCVARRLSRVASVWPVSDTRAGLM